MAKSGWDKWKEKKSREAKRELKRKAKRVHKAYIAVICIALIAGFAVSWFGLSYICSADKFEIKGEKIISFTEGQTVEYTDEGITYISFGRDMSDKVKIECELVFSDGVIRAENVKAGEYAVIYTVLEGRCKGKTLYRVIQVTPQNAENGGAE